MATLCIRRLCIPLEPILSMFMILQLAHHHTMTAFGVSEEIYASITDIPLQGVGQGNGAGPGIWSVVNAPILDMIRNNGGGAVFRTAIGMKLLELVGFSFVDDDDIVTTDDNVQTPGEDLLEKTQASTDLKNSGLHASGGALEPQNKVTYNWRLVDWKKTPTEWVPRSINEMPGDITVYDYSSQERVTIHRQEAFEARECLGVFISPCGSWKAQTVAISKKLELFGEKLRTSSLSKEETLTESKGMVWKKMEYLFPVCGMSRNQWDQALKPLIRAILGSLKTNRNFPREVFYGPKKYQGLGFIHPYDGQMITQVTTLIAEGNRGSLTGQMIEASIEQFLVEIGTIAGLNTKNCRHACHVTTCWVKDIWLYMLEHEMELTYPSTIPLACDDDFFIMDKFIQLNLDTQTIFQLNEIRMHLQLMTFADMCDVQGRFILPQFYDCSGKCWNRKLDWPRTASPSQAEISLWQESVDRALIGSSSSGT